jgi:hypothetical protein
MQPSIIYNEEKQDKTIHNQYPKQWQKAQVVAEFGLAPQVVSYMKNRISVKQRQYVGDKSNKSHCK